MTFESSLSEFCLLLSQAAESWHRFLRCQSLATASFRCLCKKYRVSWHFFFLLDTHDTVQLTSVDRAKLIHSETWVWKEGGRDEESPSINTEEHHEKQEKLENRDEQISTGFFFLRVCSNFYRKGRARILLFARQIQALEMAQKVCSILDWTSWW